MAASTPLQGKTKPVPKKTPTTTAGKVKGKPNGNIMSFFKRAESSGTSGKDVKEEDEPLFLQDSPVKGDAKMTLQTPTPPREEYSNETSPEDAEMSIRESPLSRYNEVGMPSKRRRTEDTPKQSAQIEGTKAALHRGPFVDDSDSDDEPVKAPSFLVVEKTNCELESERAVRGSPPATEKQSSGKATIGPAVPALKGETTSIGQVNDFDGIEDFIDDEFPEEGEEYLERRWMEEQAEFEEGLGEDCEAMGENPMDVAPGVTRETASVTLQQAISTSCPICGGNTTGLTDQV